MYFSAWFQRGQSTIEGMVEEKSLHQADEK